MKTVVLPVTVGWLLGASVLVCSAAEDPKEKKFKDDAQVAIESFKAADSSLTNLFQSAAGYAVFPNVGKGGLVFGGAHGRGLVYEKGVLVGKASLSQFTFGAQIGGQEFSELIFFENKTAFERFKQSRFEMSAQAEATAAAEGVAQNAKYVDGVMIFTRPKSGLMAEASVGGQQLNFYPLPTPPPATGAKK